jgi:hypothetical protein
MQVLTTVAYTEGPFGAEGTATCDTCGQTVATNNRIDDPDELQFYQAHAKTGERPTRRFTATYPNASQAKDWEANANRTTGAINIVRDGKVVTFDAPIIDRSGYYVLGDISLSVGHYGGPGTRLNGHRVPREM